MARFIYGILFILALPLILLRLWWRGRREPGYRAQIGERFGRFPQTLTSGAIWLHAVSVGEMRAAVPLVRVLRSKFPAAPLLLTCMTPTGRAMANMLFGGDAAITIAYLPYDLPWLTRRLLRRFDPQILLIMETEIWFNLVHTCSVRRLPVLLVNARLSERSRTGYARFAPIRSLVREALGAMTVVAAQSVDDASRFNSLGARKVVVTGNLKFDMPLDQALADQGSAWRAVLAGKRRVLLLAATREGEENLLLHAYRRQFDEAARNEVLLVIVPRHPQRFDEVFRLAASAGFAVARRSAATISPDKCDVWLGDSMGEMAAYYAMCDLAIIGGSFAPLGGQNLIEAAALGRPTIIGPHVFNFSDAVALAGHAGALQQVADADEAMRTARVLLADDSKRKAMSAAALAFTAAHRGATEKTAGLITAVMSPAS
ncbi:MAG TPA: lipid IV(A) 3-deoxy-D-manno-octulosonic acid transferase [Usitatibacteraceae bacterium]